MRCERTEIKKLGDRVKKYKSKGGRDCGTAAGEHSPAHPGVHELAFFLFPSSRECVLKQIPSLVGATFLN